MRAGTWKRVKIWSNCQCLGLRRDNEKAQGPQNPGSRVQGPGTRVSGSLIGIKQGIYGGTCYFGPRVQGLGFGVEGSGFGAGCAV